MSGARTIAVVLIALSVIVCGGCSCTSEFSVTGAGTADEPAVDGKCTMSASGRAAACKNALDDAFTRAKAQCPKEKPFCLPQGNSDLLIADCSRSTTTFPKPGDLCGISGTVTRNYKCCKTE